jgi:integrase
MESPPKYGDYSDLEMLRQDVARDTMRRIGEILTAQFDDGLRQRQAPPSTEIVREMFTELGDLGRSQRHIESLRSCLRPFVEKFPRLEAANDADIVAYLRDLSAKVGPRRRDNILCAIVQLSRFARRRNYLPEDRRSAAEKIRMIKPGHEVQTWAPAEMLLLLEYTSPRWFPFMVLGLFAGLRTSEIFRLDWSAIKFEERVIAVSAKVARKIRISRLVPIHPNLFAYLEPHRGRVGPIYQLNPKTAENLHAQEMNRIRRMTGLPRKDNANRHSYGSYRLAITKSYAQVALEMGNSPRMVRDSYNDPKSEADAAAYFAAPQCSDQVLSLPLEFNSPFKSVTRDAFDHQIVARIEPAKLVTKR